MQAISYGHQRSRHLEIGALQTHLNKHREFGAVQNGVMSLPARFRPSLDSPNVTPPAEGKG